MTLQDEKKVNEIAQAMSEWEQRYWILSGAAMGGLRNIETKLSAPAVAYVTAIGDALTEITRIRNLIKEMNENLEP